MRKAKQETPLTRLALLAMLVEEAERLGGVAALSRESGVHYQRLYCLIRQYEQLIGARVSSQGLSLRPDVLVCKSLANYFALTLDSVMRAFGYTEETIIRFLGEVMI